MLDHHSVVFYLNAISKHSLGLCGISKGHRGKRSKLAQEARDARKFLLTYAFIDRERAEKISRLPATFYVEHQIIKPYGQELNYYHQINVEPGDVLVDSLGRGSFQKVVEVNR